MTQDSHDRNETSHEGWLISDTYLDTAAMSQEKQNE